MRSGKMKKEDGIEKKAANREILFVTYFFVSIFAVLMGYFAYFIAFQSDEVINNSYNPRQDLLASQVIRGEIQGSKGEVLAETVTKGGTEVRRYPYDCTFSHVVGSFDKGKTGIELSENFRLLTSHTNVFSQFLLQAKGEKVAGDNIITTLDVELQKTAHDALGTKKGAVVALDPNTGKILALVSKPDYDPNQILSEWDSLVDDTENESALVNRATQGLYPPGSTFKIITALEYVREHPDDYGEYSYNCTGNGGFSGVQIKCYGNERHGKVDLKHSLSESCNTSFANLGTTLDKESFRGLCDNLLFNKPLPLNMAYKKSSFVIDKNTDDSQMPQTGIGQGKTQITPMHNCMITAAIANGGTMMKPYVIDSIETSGGSKVKKYLPETYADVMSAEEAALLTDMMQEVVDSGTGSRLSDLSYPVAGKTGSAEYDSSKASHAWFVGFAPADKPEIAVCVIVEGAGTGSAYAVPIAKRVFTNYLGN